MFPRLQIVALLLLQPLAAQSKFAPVVTDLEPFRTVNRVILNEASKAATGWSVLTIETGKIGDEPIYRIRNHYEGLHFGLLRLHVFDWVSICTQDLKLIHHMARSHVGGKETVVEIRYENSGHVTVITNKKRKRKKVEHRPDMRLSKQIMVKGMRALVEAKVRTYYLVDTETAGLSEERWFYSGKETLKSGEKSVSAHVITSSFRKDRMIKTYVDRGGHEILREEYMGTHTVDLSTEVVESLRARVRSLPEFWARFTTEMRKAWSTKGMTMSNQLAGLKLRVLRGFRRRKLPEERDDRVIMDLSGGKQPFVYQVSLGLHFDEQTPMACAEAYVKAHEKVAGFSVDALVSAKCAGRVAARLDYRAVRDGRSGCYSMWFVVRDGLLYRFLIGADGEDREISILTKLASMHRSVKFIRPASGKRSK